VGKVESGKMGVEKENEKKKKKKTRASQGVVLC
jgi:hypothetical protein